MRKLHFISGLPRSGSTLLAAILRQNPSFAAGMSSPVAALFIALQRAMAEREAAVRLDTDTKRALLAGLFEAYYRRDDRVIFDTNRAWCAKLPALLALYPRAKVVCCVRNVAWIMDSVERLIRTNAFDQSAIFGNDPRSTVYQRVGKLAASDGLVGYSLDALREAWHGEHAKHLALVRYESLVERPEGTLRQLYAALGEEWWPHDFDDVSYQAEDFDEAVGTPGLHRVRGSVAYVKRETILPPALFERFAHDDFWNEAALNRHGVPVI